MRMIIQPLKPQPVLANPKPPGRWIWGPTEPITDMCGPEGLKNGTAVCSWWNDLNKCDLIGAHCPIERPPSAKVECLYDGERWVWVVRFSEAAAKRMARAKQKVAT